MLEMRTVEHNLIKTRRIPISLHFYSTQNDIELVIVIVYAIVGVVIVFKIIVVFVVVAVVSLPIYISKGLKRKVSKGSYE